MRVCVCVLAITMFGFFHKSIVEHLVIQEKHERNGKKIVKNLNSPHQRVAQAVLSALHDNTDILYKHTAYHTT